MPDNPETAPTSEGLKKAELANIMIQEYSTLRQEALFYNNQYKSYVRYFQAALTIIIALLALFLKSDMAAVLGESRIILIFVMFAITTIVGFISFDVLDSQFSIIVLGSKLSVLESQINELTGRTILSWESHLAPKVKRRAIPIRGAFNPNIFVIVYEVIIVSVALLWTPLYWIYNFWPSASGESTLLRWLVAANVVYALLTLILIVFVSQTTLLKIHEGVRKLVLSIAEVKPEESLASSARSPPGSPARASPSAPARSAPAGWMAADDPSSPSP